MELPLGMPQGVAVRASDMSELGGTFQTIVADPPWQVGRGPEYAQGGASRPLAYRTMTVDEIRALPVKRLAASHAHLYIWTINAYIEQTYAIARAWGFVPSTMLYWLKQPRGLGLGGTFCTCVEPILFARRGTLPARTRLDRNWWGWPRGEHSAKPEEFQALVETVSPGPYLELFARRTRPGWTCWGNEV